MRLITRYALLLLLFFMVSDGAKAQLMNAKEIFDQADSLRGMLTPFRTCYDIKYYHLDIKVDINNRFISGSNLFKFESVDDFNKLQFDLFENLSVERVEYRGKELPFQRSYNAVFVDFPNIIQKGEIDSFKVYYSGIPIAATRAPWDGGFDWKKDSKGKPWVATTCQGLGASVWWPNKDHQSDEADSMLISVAVPNGVMNVSNGRLMKTEKLNKQYTKYHWKVSNPINNYNVALNIGDYVHITETYVGEKGPLSIDYYILKENKNKIEHLQRNVKQTLEAFEYWFGPYPFYEDGYKLVETAHLGMEHQSAIAYGNKYQNGYLGRDNSGSGWGLKWDFIIVHESGHEWFGNNITAMDLADMWIHESFTNYSEALFIDYHYGKEASQVYVNGNRQGILNDKPLQGPYGVNKEGSVDMYLKGGVLHNMIRTIIDNDEIWHAILRGLNSAFYHQTVDYNDILHYINDKTGIDFNPVFEQYVQRKSIPVLEVKQREDGKTLCRWIAETADFKMPIHIGKKGHSKKRYDIGSTFQVLSIDVEQMDELEIDTFNYYIGVLMN